MTLIPNTFGIPCTARQWVDYASADDLLRQLPLPPGRVLVVGQGSNMLFLRSEFDGVALHSSVRGLTELRREANGHSVVVQVGSGESVDDVIERTLSLGLHGLENLSLIPGDMGAAAVQNIGAYGAEIADVIEAVHCVHLPTARPVTLSAADMCYAYRHSRLKSDEEWGQWAVVHVDLRLGAGPYEPRLSYAHLAQLLPPQPTPSAVREAIVGLRRQKLPDPEELGNAGSFFKNPVVSGEHYAKLLQQYPQLPSYEAPDGVKLPAAWLIEKAGWKGRAMGPAAAYERQPLVLVNLGGATGSDIARLAEAIAADVQRLFGVSLSPEVNYI